MLYNGSGRRVLGALKAVFKAFLIRTSHLPVTFCGQFKASTWSSHCVKLCEIDYSLSYMSVKSKHFFMTQEIASYVIRNGRAFEWTPQKPGLFLLARLKF